MFQSMEGPEESMPLKSWKAILTLGGHVPRQAGFGGAKTQGNHGAFLALMRWHPWAHQTSGSIQTMQNMFGWPQEMATVETPTALGYSKHLTGDRHGNPWSSPFRQTRAAASTKLTDTPPWTMSSGWPLTSDFLFQKTADPPSIFVRRAMSAILFGCLTASRCWPCKMWGF